MKTPKKSERGSVLVMAIAIITMLTLLGLVVLRTVSVDIDSTGAERLSDNALYAAEAGIQWALQDLALTYNIDPANADYTAVLAQPSITGDVNCPDATCPLFGWHQLHPATMVRNFGASTFRVAVNQDSDLTTLLIRSDGRSPGGGRRVLEVAVAPK